MLKAGVFKGRAVEGSEARGLSPNGKHEMMIDVEFKHEGEVYRRTTVLYFSQEAAPYSTARLRACGWKGDDLSEPLAGLGANEIEIEVSYEEYEGKQRMKVQIASGGGQFKTKNPATDPKAWAAGAAMASGLPVGPKGGNVPKPGF
jgi:hypothetical protein